MHLPPISVLVPTYGRTTLLRECMESYLRQDYAGTSEMIILNDHPEQTLEYYGDNTGKDQGIIIVNEPARRANLGEKRATLLGLARFNNILCWDDDDIYLPDALTTLATLRARAPAWARCVKASHCWQFQADTGARRGIPVEAGVEVIMRDSGHLWCALMDRAAILEAGGFPPLDRMQDVSLSMAMIAHGWVHAEATPTGKPFCIRRLAGTGRYPHAVDSWPGFQENPRSAALHDQGIAAVMDAGVEPRGLISLTPGWARDYVALCDRAWDGV